MDAYLTAEKRFVLGDGAEVTFVGNTPYELVNADIGKLKIVFAGQMNLTGNAIVHDHIEARTRVTNFLAKVYHVEIRGLVTALRKMADARNPVVSYAHVPGNASFFRI